MARAAATHRRTGAYPRGHYVYLVRASDGAYYCGYTVDPAARVAVHNAGKGSKSLRGRRPVRLVYVRRFTDRSAALRYEIALKSRTHREKAHLVTVWKDKHSFVNKQARRIGPRAVT